ncbi:MAG: ribosome biogenesis GTPase Der [Planctomycetia bacterium]|jgi:GTP-binding protein
MGVPHIVIVGRPNVGKSSLFNWLAGKRLAIVDPTAGVTRDRVIHLAELEDRFVELVDTGGMGVIDSDDLTDHIEEQIRTAVEAADVILFVVDTLEGTMPLDEEVARRLRYATAPIICVANKTDHEGVETQAGNFYRFGHLVIQVSAEQNRGKQQLIDAILERLPPAEEGDDDLIHEPEMKVALVGRRNTGKSTFINTLTQTDRMIVSEVPGTTRDSVDVRFELDSKAFVAIDTPGLRRGKSVKTNVDYFGTHRAYRSIRRADVTLLFFDASQRISKVDKQLCDYISKEYKPCIFVVNKWDLLADSMPTERWVTYLRDTFRTMWHVPIAFITGETGRNVKKLINHAQMLFKQARSRVSTSELNQLMKAALEHNPPPLVYHRRPKIYYATQVASQPPTIVMFCNNPKWLSNTYKRYLLGVFRDQLEFGEVPIKLYLRRREKDDETDHMS